MAISMTGFGRSEFLDEKFHFIVECKSINHKYLDLSIKMPRKISYLEEKLRNVVKNQVKRGRIEVYIKMETLGESDISLKLDDNLAKEYVAMLKNIKDKYDLVDDISVMNVARFPDMIKINEKENDEDELFSVLSKTLEQSVAKLCHMRSEKGSKLSEDIKGRCDTLISYMSDIEQSSHSLVQEYKEKLENRISEIIGANMHLNEERLVQEVAYFADKSDISEEIVRFNSHINQLKSTIDAKEPIGRKLDFLIQEINRESNTIASKSSNLKITNLVVDIKSELEKIREQIQNIE